MRRGVPELKKELRELEKSYSEVVDSNVRLVDEARWAREDKERAFNRIKRALELINKTNFESHILKRELIIALTEDFIDE